MSLTEKDPLSRMEGWALAAIEKRVELRKAHPGLFDAPALMVLVLRREARSDRMRLAGRHGPLGHVLCSAADGEATVQFDAAEVLAWIRKTRGRLS